MTIKVFEKTEGCLPEVIQKGDWIDLKLAEDITLATPCAMQLKRAGKSQQNNDRVRKVLFNSVIAHLGVCMQLPEGCEAIVAPRSSTFKDYGILHAGSISIIDNSYASENDEWKMPMLATRKVTIPKGTRIAQFRVQLNQKATFWQKLRWLFLSGIRIEKVSHLDNPTRGGFGSTNITPNVESNNEDNAQKTD